MDKKEALEELAHNIRLIKIKTFDYLDQVYKMKEEDFKHSGHKTKTDALVWIMKKHSEEIEQLIKRFEKRYPE